MRYFIGLACILVCELNTYVAQRITEEPAADPDPAFLEALSRYPFVLKQEGKVLSVRYSSKVQNYESPKLLPISSLRPRNRDYHGAELLILKNYPHFKGSYFKGKFEIAWYDKQDLCLSYFMVGAYIGWGLSTYQCDTNHILEYGRGNPNDNDFQFRKIQCYGYCGGSRRRDPTQENKYVLMQQYTSILYCNDGDICRKNTKMYDTAASIIHNSSGKYDKYFFEIKVICPMFQKFDYNTNTCVEDPESLVPAETLKVFEDQLMILMHDQYAISAKHHGVTRHSDPQLVHQTDLPKSAAEMQKLSALSVRTDPNSQVLQIHWLWRPSLCLRFYDKTMHLSTENCSGWNGSSNNDINFKFRFRRLQGDYKGRFALMIEKYDNAFVRCEVGYGFRGLCRVDRYDTMPFPHEFNPDHMFDFKTYCLGDQKHKTKAIQAAKDNDLKCYDYEN